MGIVKYYFARLLKKMRFSAIIGSNIHPTAVIESGCHIVYSSFGKYSFCGYDCQIINCEIGSFCSLADNIIIGGAKHPINWVSTSPVFYFGRDSVKKKFSEYKRDKDKTTYIGHDVWIGSSAILLQGVNIGSGAIVGAGSIVTKDVPPYTIVAGNPAKVIRKRFADNIVDELLNSKWWDLPEKELKKLSQYIRNPELFIIKYKEI